MDQSAVEVAQCLVNTINNVFLFPLIALLSAVAFIVFLYGAFEYVRNAASQEGRQTGQRHLLYGLVGLLVMFSAFTILQIAAGTFGLSADTRMVMCSEGAGSTAASEPDAASGFMSPPTVPTGLDRSPGTGAGEEVVTRPGAPSQPDAASASDSPDGLPTVDTSRTCPSGTELVGVNCVRINEDFEPVTNQDTPTGEVEIKCVSSSCISAMNECNTTYNGVAKVERRLEYDDQNNVTGRYIRCVVD